MQRSLKTFTFLATALLLVSCMPHLFSKETASPGETAFTAEWLLKGAANPSRQVVVLVFNKKGQMLLSQVAREDGMNVALGNESPSGGENALQWENFVKIMDATGVSFIQLQYILSDDNQPARPGQPLREPLFDLMATGKWHGEMGRQYAEVYWHLLNEQEITDALTHPTATPTVLYALKWATPFAKRKDNETAQETALRAARNQLGVPAEKLKAQDYWYNPETETAYMRLQYTGGSKDVFVIADPERGTHRNYRLTAQWRAKPHASVRLLRSYLRIIEGVPLEQEIRLFK